MIYLHTAHYKCLDIQSVRSYILSCSSEAGGGREGGREGGRGGGREGQEGEEGRDKKGQGGREICKLGVYSAQEGMDNEGRKVQALFTREF